MIKCSGNFSSVAPDVAVLIAGAGPTGLTLACDLFRRGVRCRIIDAAPDPFVGSRAKGLMPRTLEVFEDLGVIEAVLAGGGAFPPFRGYTGGAVAWDRTIYEMAGFPRLPSTTDLPYTDFWMVPQWRTCGILRNRLGELGGAVELGTQLTDFLQTADGIRAVLTKDGARQEVRADYLVGADGGGSFVRRRSGLGFIGETDETDRSIIADVRAEGVDREHWHMWTDAADPARRVALCPLPETDIFQFVAPVPAGTCPELTLESLQAILNERSGGADVRLSSLGWVTLYRVNIRLAEHFRAGRVFLAGDAAHVHFPGGGQGLNTGIQDAYNLGWKLASVLNGAPPQLLDTYEEERLPVAAGVLGFSSQLRGRGMHTSAAPTQEPEHDVFQLKLNYRHGSLARETRNSPGRVRAGDRAPDAVCEHPDGNPLRLFDIFRGTHFTLLLFGESSGGFGHGMSALSAAGLHSFKVLPAGTEADGNDCLIDAGGQIRENYDVCGDTVILVRPDGYIGFAGSTQEGLRDYLSQVGN